MLHFQIIVPGLIDGYAIPHATCISELLIALDISLLTDLMNIIQYIH